MNLLQNRESKTSLIRRAQITTAEVYKSVPFHAFFFATFPILSLLAINIDQIYIRDGFVPILLSLTMVGIILCGLRILTRDWQLAGLISSLMVVWFFMYGRIYDSLKTIRVLGLLIGRHRYLLVVWSVIILIIVCWALRKSLDIPNLSIVLNIFSSILILIPTIQIVVFSLRILTPSKIEEVSPNNQLIAWKEDSTPPDIYFIVLDGYVRSDVLQQVYGLDNAPFLQELEELGFFSSQNALEAITTVQVIP